MRKLTGGPTSVLMDTYEANLISVMDRDQTYWVPSLSWPPSFQNCNWIIWQYTSTGKVNGIKTDVDLNVFRETGKVLPSILNNIHVLSVFDVAYSTARAISKLVASLGKEAQTPDILRLIEKQPA